MASQVERTRAPASANQTRMFVLDRLSPGGTEYNVPVALKIDGRLDVARLRRTLSALTRRHPVLRASFTLVGDEVVQRIARRVRVTLPRRRAEGTAELDAIRRRFVRPFDLGRSPLLRACLVRTGEDAHVLLLDFHHIVCDGVSVDILLEELGRLYAGELLPRPAGRYRDFARWQRRFAETPEARRQEEFWLRLLAGDRPVLDLSTDFPRRRARSYHGDRVFVRPGTGLTAALRALGAKNRVSMYILLLAAYYVLLAKTTGQDDLLVGTLVSGRTDERFRDVVGLFVNTLVLRSRPRGELEFTEYLRQVREECLDAFENQDYQFEALVDRLDPPRDLGRNPLFDTLFAVLTADRRAVRYDGVEMSRFELDYEISKFDLSLTAIEYQDQDLVLEFEYATELFRRETVERLAERYLAVLGQIAADPTVTLSRIDLRSVEEQLGAAPVPPLEETAWTAGRTAEARSVVERFAEHAGRSPSSPALSWRETTLTYGVLDHRSSALAASLADRGVARGDLVGLVAAPAPEMVVAILGILKLGAAYLPLDPTIPVERFRSIAEDSGLATVLVHGDARHLASGGVATLDLDAEIHRSTGSPPAFVPPDPAELAYVIYTSGSTGAPKGVMISHGALTNYVEWATRTYVDDRAAVFALHSPASVDLTVTSIFVPLTSGNEVVVYRGDDPAGLFRELLEDGRATLVKLTPTHLRLLAELIPADAPAPTALRRLIVGGEDLETGLAKRIHDLLGGRVEIFNEYGPTEACVGCTVHRYLPAEDVARSVPIGEPIGNTRVALLDPYGGPVPGAVTGNLFVAGACLARGYLNRPRLTAERFVPDPFGPPSQRLYETGDLARELPTGGLDYLGRSDDQVKIRGFRIELGEIEAHLRRLAGIGDAVVVRRWDAAGDPYLCAYVVPSGDGTEAVGADDVRSRLAQHLPESMIPARCVTLERLPISRGGKLDKQALPDPGPPETATGGFVAPRFTAEAAMATIWEQVLGRPRVGIDDNFFELGGQSLKATLMTARVNRDLHTHITLQDVFAHPVIRELAALAARTAEDPSIAIEPVLAREYYPASAAQKRLYILHQLAPVDLQYNVPWALSITGEIDLARWQQAFTALIARHEALRTSFHLIGDEIVQQVEPAAPFLFEPWAGEAGSPLEESLVRFVRPFNLKRAPLIRATVAETGPSAHTLLADMHHIVSDGMSVEIIADELVALYRGDRLEPLPVQYKDYAIWQRSHAGDPALREQKAYWTRLFEDGAPVLDLPTDLPRQAVQSFDGDLVAFGVGAATAERLKALDRASGTTLHMTLLAAYMVLLAKYSGQEDIVVGTPVAGRSDASIQRLVGMFVNTLALRGQPRRALRFDQFLDEIKTRVLDAYRNQDFQFDELVETLAVERDLSRSPLFDTVFASAEDRTRRWTLDGLTLEVLDFDWKVAKFDLTLLATLHEAGIDFELEYCTRLFHRTTIRRLGGHYRHLLEQIAASPRTRIAELDLLTRPERQQLLLELAEVAEAGEPVELAGPRPLAGDTPSIHALFERRATSAPDRIAVVHGDRSVSYGEIDRRADRIARALLAASVGREEVVALIAGPSVGMIAGILGVLKAGCAYLPIDPDAPAQRTAAMLADSGVRIVLEAGGATWRDEKRRVLDLDDPSSLDALAQGEASAPAVPVTGGNLAYVIYTSGTTGTPKGVMIEHRSVNNLCAWHRDAFQVTADDRATKYARFGFDASVWEIFPYLQAGASLHMIDEAIRLDLYRLGRFFDERGISIAFLPTQVCELYLEQESSSLRVLLTGGDRLRLVRPRSYRLVNNYGPTEDTVVTTSGTVAGNGERIPIGRPLANTRVVLLDRGHGPVPFGVPGELCVSGVGLARGYLGDPRKTAAKFLPSPVEPGARTYRTGDLARWRTDGELEFIGRTDQQVKVRGCRTEPREIETTILAHPAVQDAVVVALREADGSSALAAYVVWNDGDDDAGLRAHLAERLPDYMVPSALYSIDAIPMNDRGKVDAGALPRPERNGRPHVAPRTDLERRLAAIWREVLGRDAVGVHDNFFEIGGHSLRATVMLAKANRELDAEVALGTVFDHPTIAALAPHFEAAARPALSMIPRAPDRLAYATTPTQKLLYLVCSSQKGIEYNLPMAFRLDGDLDAERLESALRRLIHRHEALRTSFRVVDGQIVQVVSRAVEFALDRRDEVAEDEIREVMRDFVRPFDLDRAPLVRAALVPMGSERHVLLLDVHHLVSDGTSMGILFEELAALYAGHEPALPETTVKDFAEWLGEHLQSERVREQEAYWRAALADPPPPVRLDSDYRRSGSFAFVGSRLEFAASEALHRGLTKLCSSHRATLYMLLLAAYTALLSKYSAREDVIVGVPTAGRTIADVQNLIGMFVSTHAVRSRPRADLPFDAFLEQVKTAVRGALENQDYQLWDLMLSHADRHGGRPLFNTIFVVQDQSFEAMAIPGIEVEELVVPYHVSKFDLTLAAVEREGRLDFELEYATDLFRRATAQRIARNFLTLLEQIVAHPERELGRLELLTPEEKRRLLLELNHRAEAPGAGTDPSAETGLLRQIELQAQTSPDRVAVVAGDRYLSYGALDRRARSLAGRLVDEGIAPGDVVGILAAPSPAMVAAVLAVWKAGAAYLPLGRSFPAARIDRLVRTSGAKLVLGDPAAARRLSGPRLLDLDGAANGDHGRVRTARPAADPDLACVVSAGDPEGGTRAVMVGHRALAHRCRWYAERFALTASDRGSKYGDLSAAASVFELFPLLAVGASVSLLPERAGDDLALLVDRLGRDRVTVGWLPAPLCEHLASAEPGSLRALLTFGRTVSPERRGDYELVSCYGCAETAEVVACTAVGAGASSVAGPPVAGAEAYVLAHDGGLQPVGVSGDLWVGGAGLALGYLGDPAKTARRFTANPHAGGATMFRTGDRARWLADGRLEIIGRTEQVPVDGHRVCFAEIERALAAHPDVEDAVVVYDDLDPCDDRLIAYLVLRQGLVSPPAPWVRDVKARLAARLPARHVPDTYLQVAAIPREADGQVDTGLLPKPERGATRIDRSKATRQVAALVEELLGVPEVDTDSDLVSLGMTSLDAMALLARIGGTLGVSPTIDQLTCRPTLSGVSDWVAQAVHACQAGQPTQRAKAPSAEPSRVP